MAGTLMILNPAKRRRKSRKRRSPAQLAATRKLVALNRRRGRGGARRRPAKRRAARRAPARRRNPSFAAAYRPRRRRRARGLAGLGGLTGAFIPAAIGAGGALALDVAWGMLPIPIMLKTGMMAPIAKLGGAVVLGWGAGQMVNKTFGRQVMVGAVTITVFNIVRGFIATRFPQITLGGYDEETLQFVNAAQFQPDPLMGEYVSGYIPDYETRESAGMAGMGEYVSGYDAYGN